MNFNSENYTSSMISSIAKNLELSVFECESSGGVEWLREDNFNLGKIFTQASRFFEICFFRII